MKKIYTIGSGNRSPQEFLDLLSHYGIKHIVDVRSHPSSRFKHFKKKPLQELLRENDVHYTYMGRELGGFREEGYEEYQRSAAFGEALVRLEQEGAALLLALLCAERLPWKCHRSHIGRALEERGWSVDHIIDSGRLWEKGQLYEHNGQNSFKTY